VASISERKRSSFCRALAAFNRAWPTSTSESFPWAACPAASFPSPSHLWKTLRCRAAFRFRTCQSK
jgi:hypothetical protein